MSKKVQTPIDSLKWLTLAASKSPADRPTLSWAYADDERGQTVTSDGYRLHVVKEVLPGAREDGLIQLPKSRDTYMGTKFVDYLRELQSEFETVVRVYGHDLRKAIQRALVFAPDSHKVYLVFKASQYPGNPSNIHVIGKGDEGEVESPVDVDMKSEESRIDTAFNGKFLLDALRGLYLRDDDVVILRLRNSGGYTMLLTTESESRLAIIRGMYMAQDQLYGTAPTVAQPSEYTPQPVEQYESRVTPRIYPHPTNTAINNLLREAETYKFVPARQILLIKPPLWAGYERGYIVAFGRSETVIHEFWHYPAPRPLDHYETHLPALNYERFQRRTIDAT